MASIWLVWPRRELSRSPALVRQMPPSDQSADRSIERSIETPYVCALGAASVRVSDDDKQPSNVSGVVVRHHPPCPAQLLLVIGRSQHHVVLTWLHTRSPHNHSKRRALRPGVARSHPAAAPWRPTPQPAAGRRLDFDWGHPVDTSTTCTRRARQAATSHAARQGGTEEGRAWAEAATSAQRAGGALLPAGMPWCVSSQHVVLVIAENRGPRGLGPLPLLTLTLTYPGRLRVDSPRDRPEKSAGRLRASLAAATATTRTCWMGVVV